MTVFPHAASVAAAVSPTIAAAAAAAVVAIVAATAGRSLMILLFFLFLLRLVLCRKYRYLDTLISGKKLGSGRPLNYGSGNHVQHPRTSSIPGKVEHTYKLEKLFKRMVSTETHCSLPNHHPRCAVL
jgi:hypothetical protein